MPRRPPPWILLSALLLGCSDDRSTMGSGSDSSSSSAPEGSSAPESRSSTEGSSSTDGGAPVQCERGGWDGNDGAEDSGFGMGDDMPLPFTAYEVQQGDAPDGARIVLSNVVVTTPAAVSEVLSGYELFVQEQAGGPYSGLRIHAGGFDPSTVLAVGDAVDVTGRVSRYGDYVLLELASSDDVLVTGTAALPAPVVVEAAELLTTNPMARPYEGVKVRVQEATVTDDDPCDGEFVLDEAVRVDDRFMPGALASPGLGEVFAAVEGVLVYANDGYELAPPDGASIDE